MTPTVTPAQPLWETIIQAILAGLQIATAALPVVQQYRQTFAESPITAITAPVLAQTSQLHPATHGIVVAALTPLPAAGKSEAALNTK